MIHVDDIVTFESGADVIEAKVEYVYREQQLAHLHGFMDCVPFHRLTVVKRFWTFDSAPRVGATYRGVEQDG